MKDSGTCGVVEVSKDTWEVSGTESQGVKYKVMITAQHETSAVLSIFVENPQIIPGIFQERDGHLGSRDRPCSGQGHVLSCHHPRCGGELGTPCGLAPPPTQTFPS